MTSSTNMNNLRCSVAVYPWNCADSDDVACIRGDVSNFKNIAMMVLITISGVAGMVVFVCMGLIMYGAWDRTAYGEDSRQQHQQDQEDQELEQEEEDQAQDQEEDQAQECQDHQHQEQHHQQQETNSDEYIHHKSEAMSYGAWDRKASAEEDSCQQHQQDREDDREEDRDEVQHPQQETNSYEYIDHIPEAVQKALVKQAFMYIIVFAVLWGIRLVNVLLSDSYVVIQCLALLSTLVQPMFNAIIFFFHKVDNIQRIDISISTYRALQMLIISPRDEMIEIGLSNLSQISQDRRDNMMISSPPSSCPEEAFGEASVENYGLSDASKDVNLSVFELPSEELSFMLDCTSVVGESVSKNAFTLQNLELFNSTTRTTRN